MCGGGGGALGPQPTQMCKYESDGHGSVFWLQVSEVSGHVSTQNGYQMCPFTPFGGFLWTLSTGFYFQSLS